MDNEAKDFFEKLANKSHPDISFEESEEQPEIELTKATTETKRRSPKSNAKAENRESGWLDEPVEEGQLTVDIWQTPAEIVIQSTIAGVKPEDLDVTITNEMVTIRGKREKEEQVAESDYFHQECYWGHFVRSIILPQEIDADNAAAILKNGILTIRLPKLKREKTKKIKVKSI